MTSVEVWLDGVRCGEGVELVGGEKEEEEEEWVRVGAEVQVAGGEGGGEGSTIAVVVTSQAAGEEGWEVWIDDVGVVGC